MTSIVFGAGTSHTPMLNAAVEEWPLFEAIDRRRALLHKDGRPATYEELVAVAPPGLQAELAPEKLSLRHAGAIPAKSSRPVFLWVILARHSRRQLQRQRRGQRDGRELWCAQSVSHGHAIDGLVGGRVPRGGGGIFAAASARLP